jgi:hypothetical protein
MIIASMLVRGGCNLQAPTEEQSREGQQRKLSCLIHRVNPAEILK